MATLVLDLVMELKNLSSKIGDKVCDWPIKLPGLVSAGWPGQLVLVTIPPIRQMVSKPPTPLFPLVYPLHLVSRERVRGAERPNWSV